MNRAAIEITPSELQTKLREDPPPVLLDVRQPQEFAICALPGATLIPLHELPNRTDDLVTLAHGRPIVAYCHHGMRSMQAALFLMRAGFAEVRSLAGGIDQWSQQIDSNVPRY